MGKKLVINAACCDLRGMKEEEIQNYEKICIEAATVIVSDEVQKLMTKYPVQMEAAYIVKIPAEAKLIQKNGKFEIDGNPSEENGEICLVLNGILTVRESGKEQLRNYAKILVNGKVIYPESCASVMAGILQINGKEIMYPDGAEFMNQELKADRLFTLRCKPNKLYFTTKKALLTDSNLNLAPLLEKGVKIHAEQGAVVADRLLEQAVEILDEKTDITVVEDGFCYAPGGQELDATFTAKFAPRVYVDGDLSVSDRESLEKIEKLQVKGTAKVREELKDVFLSRCSEFGSLRILSGSIIDDEIDVLVDAAALNGVKKLLVNDCVNVTIADDVTAEMVQEKLTINDCVSITCRKELLGVVRLTASDCVTIQAAEEDAPRSAEEGAEDDTVRIECAAYTM